MTPRQKKTSPFREWKRKQAYNILPLFSFIATLLIRLAGVTMRTRFTGHLAVLEMVEAGEPFVLAFFHGRLFLLAQSLLGWPAVVMISSSYLGEIQTRIVHNFGYTTIRGSRSRAGPRVLAKMVGHVRKGSIGFFAVDGPRGPGREVKPGVVFVAKKLNVPVVPISTSAWPSVILKSLWDRFLLPLPFSKVIIHLGEPIYLENDLSEECIQEDCLRIGRSLEKLEAEADVLSGRTKI